jgi:hypothetical protein
MSNLSADKRTEYREGVEIALPVDAGDIIYAGALVCVDADGNAVRGADAAGIMFVGVAREYVDNSLGADGAKTALVRRRGLFKMTLGHAIAQANVGDHVYVVDDQTVDVLAQVTNGIFCGVIAEYIDATHAWVDIEPAYWSTDVTTHINDSSGAHAASAISTADAGDHFAATTDTVEEQIQALAKGPFFLTIPRFTGWTKDGAAHVVPIPLVESPVPVRIKRAYANLGTAPGAGKTLALTVNGSALLSIADAATQGEAEALDIAIAKDTDIAISANETAAGSGANCDIILVLYVDDGE